MHGLRLGIDQKSYAFTATGTYNPFTANAPAGVSPAPLLRAPKNWSLQCTGLNAAGVPAIMGAWSVTLMGSLDGLSYPTTILTCAGTGVISNSVNTGATVQKYKYYQIVCGTFTLSGGTAVSLLATVVAD